MDVDVGDAGVGVNERPVAEVEDPSTDKVLLLLRRKIATLERELIRKEKEIDYMEAQAQDDAPIDGTGTVDADRAKELRDAKDAYAKLELRMLDTQKEAAEREDDSTAKRERQRQREELGQLPRATSAVPKERSLHAMLVEVQRRMADLEGTNKHGQSGLRMLREQHKPWKAKFGDTITALGCIVLQLEAQEWNQSASELAILAQVVRVVNSANGSSAWKSWCKGVEGSSDAILEQGAELTLGLFFKFLLKYLKATVGDLVATWMRVANAGSGLSGASVSVHAGGPLGARIPAWNLTQGPEQFHHALHVSLDVLQAILDAPISDGVVEGIQRALSDESRAGGQVSVEQGRDWMRASYALQLTRAICGVVGARYGDAESWLQRATSHATGQLDDARLGTVPAEAASLRVAIGRSRETFNALTLHGVLPASSTGGEPHQCSVAGVRRLVAEAHAALKDVWATVQREALNRALHATTVLPGKGKGVPKTTVGSVKGRREATRGVCKFWQSGRCREGQRCRYAHRERKPAEARPPTPGPVCHGFLSGACSFPGCKYRHIEFDELTEVEQAYYMERQGRKRKQVGGATGAPPQKAPASPPCAKCGIRHRSPTCPDFGQ